MPLLSIITATIGRSGLARAFSSVQHQSVDVDYEVLVAADVHDGPLPAVQALVARMGSRYRYFPTDVGFHCWGNLNRQSVLSEARGEWMAYLDDDDILTQNAFASISGAIRSQTSRRPFLFRFVSPWGERLWDQQRLEVGRISGQCIVFPNDPERIGCWGAHYQGDFQFIEQTLALWPTGPDWRDDVICIARPSEPDDWTRGCLQGEAEA